MHLKIAAVSLRVTIDHMNDDDDDGFGRTRSRCSICYEIDVKVINAFANELCIHTYTHAVVVYGLFIKVQFSLSRRNALNKRLKMGVRSENSRTDGTTPVIWVRVTLCMHFALHQLFYLKKCVRSSVSCETNWFCGCLNSWANFFFLFFVIFFTILRVTRSLQCKLEAVPLVDEITLEAFLGTVEFINSILY